MRKIHIYLRGKETQSVAKSPDESNSYSFDFFIYIYMIEILI